MFFLEYYYFKEKNFFTFIEWLIKGWNLKNIFVGENRLLR
jgi:hypothetical protein